MSRRNFHQAAKGQLYAVEWPEWHVECAASGCDETALVAETGRCSTLREATVRSHRRDCDALHDWKNRKGFWYCPKHAGAEGDSRGR